MAKYAIEIPNPEGPQFDENGNYAKEYKPRIIVGVAADLVDVHGTGALVFVNIPVTSPPRVVRALATGEWFTVVEVPEGENENP